MLILFGRQLAHHLEGGTHPCHADFFPSQTGYTSPIAAVRPAASFRAIVRFPNTSVSGSYNLYCIRAYTTGVGMCVPKPASLDDDDDTTQYKYTITQYNTCIILYTCAQHSRWIRGGFAYVCICVSAGRGECASFEWNVCCRRFTAPHQRRSVAATVFRNYDILLKTHYSCRN